MKIWDTIVIGGGQAGLASGYYLKTSGRSFLILEAGGQAAGSWPYYYDSLKLFSPAKYSSLPGLPLASPGERYPLRDEVIAYLNEYARFFELPLVFHTRSIEVLRNNTGVFEIHTSSGKTYLSRTLICATGSFNKPYVPQITGEQTYKGSITHSAFYRSPEAYKDQRVIVVGRGNSAVQISMELAEVAHATLAVREPVSLVPQRILGRDIHDWFKWFGIDSVWPIGKKLALNSSIQEEVDKRRTFAIISHPDAGKTTLTEKLLLFGGAIRLAGTVKARKASKHATSDWMEIEKQRGISVTSSVMQFDYLGHRVNILDTPGHQDFSEDTYRTLTAADSAVMLIDVAKGVEAQTIKLFQVCAKRGIPIFTFINKLDREGQSPFDLMEELERVLGIRSVPMNWPIGMGRDLCGVYDRMKSQVELFQGDDHSTIKVQKVDGYEDPVIREMAGDFLHDQLKQDLELLDVAGDQFDLEKVLKGELTPVFFGSAVNNFGVQTFLENFLELAPKPEPRKSTEGVVEPTNEKFSGYVFKIQANMNPAHRDRVAFLRIVSGKFERGMSVKHVRVGKEIKLSQPQQFLAQDRDIVQEAYPGDIIGLFDPGIFRIGDSLSQGSEIVFDELPTFSPEIFSKVTAKNALKHKQYQKGIDQLTEEGTIQVFRTASFDETILGVVGQLQFEVFEHRMKAEYGVEVQLQRMPYQFARWIIDDKIDPSKFRINSTLVKDKKDNYVVLFENEYAMRTAIEKNPTAKFLETAP